MDALAKADKAQLKELGIQVIADGLQKDR